MKETFWFRHDYNARNDEKILAIRAEFGDAGYGLYWMLVESMAESSSGHLNRGAIAGLSVGLGVEKNLLTRFVDYCISIELFRVEGKDKFYSPRILSHKAERVAFSDAGRRGAKAKWSQKDSQANGEANGPPDAEQSRAEQNRAEQNVASLEKPASQTPSPTPRRSYSDDDAAAMRSQLSSLVEQHGWCDRPYLEKLWRQHQELSPINRQEFYRKLRVCLNSSGHQRTLGLARKIFHELAGLVNDRGEMERQLSDKEQAARREFIEGKADG